jgi:UDPglucose 6-dehydrogenase
LKEKVIGVIGLGTVGKSVKHIFSYYFTTVGYDPKGDYKWDDILTSRIVFICVPTPEGPDGRLDCSIIENVLQRLSVDGYNGIIVIKSTISIGFMDKALSEFPEFKMIYMPEFLREKSSFSWFVAPDRLVISGDSDDIEEVLRYFHWIDENVPILKMTHREAEIGKLAHNAFIAVKVSFTNEIETICRENDADPENVMRVIWADRRVKSKEHLQPNLGPYGGKCVPKDTRELINASESTILIKAAEQVNEKTRQFYNSINHRTEEKNKQA